MQGWFSIAADSREVHLLLPSPKLATVRRHIPEENDREGSSSHDLVFAYCRDDVFSTSLIGELEECVLQAGQQQAKRHQQPGRVQEAPVCALLLPRKRTGTYFLRYIYLDVLRRSRPTYL